MGSDGVVCFPRAWKPPQLCAWFRALGGRTPPDPTHLRRRDPRHPCQAPAKVPVDALREYVDRQHALAGDTSAAHDNAG